MAHSAPSRVVTRSPSAHAVGTYSVDAVDGDTLTVTITYDGRAPETSMFQVLGSDRVVMTNVGKTVTIPLLRK